VYIQKLEVYLLYSAKAGHFTIYTLNSQNQLNKLIETDYSPVKFSKFFIPRPQSGIVYLNFWEDGIKELKIEMTGIESSQEQVLAPIKP
jgi:hypothetical protein